MIHKPVHYTNTDFNIHFWSEDEFDGVRHKISLWQEWNGKKEIRKTVEFWEVGEEYTSPLLSWYNLFFCSNNYGSAPDYKYMNTAVQNGTKTTATIYVNEGTKVYQNLQDHMPAHCYMVPYGEGVFYLYRDGTLGDYFDLVKLRNIYEKHGKHAICWDIVETFFKMPLADFGDPQECGFTLHGGDSHEQRIVIGLLLGYPVESTVGWVNA